MCFNISLRVFRTKFFKDCTKRKTPYKYSIYENASNIVHFFILSRSKQHGNRVLFKIINTPSESLRDNLRAKKEILARKLNTLPDENIVRTVFWEVIYLEPFEERNIENVIYYQRKDMCI